MCILLHLVGFFLTLHFRKLIVLGPADPDGEVATVLRNVGRYLPKDRASHHEIGILDDVMFVLFEWQQLALGEVLPDSPPL